MKTFLTSCKNFILRYPAVLAAYFIYGYYFISTLDFYIKFKKKHFGASEALQHFDTLFWMWIFAYIMIKVIEYREKLHQKEKEISDREYSLQLKEVQLTTLHEVLATLKHEINNPLAIIMGYVRLLRKKTFDEDVTKKLNEIEDASQRIHQALADFSEQKTYQVSPMAAGNRVERASENSASQTDSPAA